MQDRVGPNRARISILPGLGNSPLGGLPHVLADSLKMLTKEGFRPASASALLFELAPVLNFAPIFCLFAVVPVGPTVVIGNVATSLQVMSPDFGVLYIFALASIAVYGTALAGWASNNKFALLGGVRATSQMISYEVALGLSLVGMMIGLTLGLVVIAGAGTLYFNSTRSLTFALNASRLDQDMQTVMESMMRDIRRAQYNPRAYQCASTGCADPFASGAGAFASYDSSGLANTNNATRLQYAFDTDGNGVLDSGECSGFRLADAGGMGRIDKITGCPRGSGAEPTWTALTDPAALNVTQLGFSVANVCIGPTGAAGGFLAVRDVLVFLEAGNGSLKRRLCEKVHVSSDVYGAACTASSFSSTSPFTAANGCPP